MLYGPPLLILIALILTLISAFGGSTPYVNIGWLGIAFFIASFLPTAIHPFIR